MLVKLIHAESNQLRDTQGRREGQVQHGSVSHSRHRTADWRIEKRQQLIAGQIAGQRFINFLHWDRMNSARLVQAGHQAVFQESEK